MTHASAAPRGWPYRIPVLGWIAHDLLHKGPENIWYFLVMVLSLLAIATMTWGLPVLGLTALAMVPVMFVVLILLTVGK
jgi:hypothetical protein